MWKYSVMFDSVKVDIYDMVPLLYFNKNLRIKIYNNESNHY